MRKRLPNRRFAETVMVDYGNTSFEVTIGFYPDGRPGEVCTHAAFKGSALEGLLIDSCVLISTLIQHGVRPRDIAASMCRLNNSVPTSVIGAVVDTVVQACSPRYEGTDEMCAAKGGGHATREALISKVRRMNSTDLPGLLRPAPPPPI